MILTYYETLEEAEDAKTYEEHLGNYVTLVHQRGVFEMRVWPKKESNKNLEKLRGITQHMGTFHTYEHNYARSGEGIPEHHTPNNGRTPVRGGGD